MYLGTFYLAIFVYDTKRATVNDSSTVLERKWSKNGYTVVHDGMISREDERMHSY